MGADDISSMEHADRSGVAGNDRKHHFPTATALGELRRLESSGPFRRAPCVSGGDETTVHENVYDARRYRIRKDTYTSGTLSESRRYYYTPGWQCLEKRTGTTTTAERQFVWGLRYIDDLILRDRATANNGTIKQRRYVLQDGNWNTIALCDITGFVTERFAHSACGTPVFMTSEAGTESGTQYVAKQYKTIHNVESAAVAGSSQNRRND